MAAKDFAVTNVVTFAASMALVMPNRKGIMRCTNLGPNAIWYNKFATATAAVAGGDDMGVIPVGVPVMIQFNIPGKQFVRAETADSRLVIESGGLGA